MKDKLFSFSEFEALYESYGLIEEAEAIIPEATPADMKADISDPFAQLLANVEQEEKKTEEVKEADEDPTDNPPAPPAKGEATGTQPAKAAPSKVKVKKTVVKQTPLVKALSLRNIKLGEKSERVKKVQEILGIEQTGNFDRKTQSAVKAFQKEHGLLIDGIVGVQTYGALLQVKKDIVDMSEIQKLIEALGKLTKNLVFDPSFYRVCKSVTIINVKGREYIIIVPESNCKEELKKMQDDGVLDAGNSWLLDLAKGIGNAIVLTLGAVVVVPLLAATALIQAAASVITAVAKGVVTVVSAVVQGLVKVTKWVAEGAWTALKKGADVVAGLFKGAAEVFGPVLKAGADAGKALWTFTCVLTQTIGKGLAYVGEAVWTGIKTAGKAIWGAAKTIGEGLKSGAQWLAKNVSDAGKAIVSGVKSGAAWVGNAVQELGNAALSGAKTIGKGVAAVVGTTIKVAGQIVSGIGDAAQAVGDFFLGFVKESFEETGEKIYEQAMFEAITAFKMV